MLSQNIKDLAKYKRDQALDRIYKKHLVEIYNGSGKVFRISDEYNGVWLEHAFDGVAWVNYDASCSEISLNHVNLFFNFQRPNGQLPSVVSFKNNMFSHIQECVPFAKVCELALRQNDYKSFSKIYNGLKKWNDWLIKNHSDQRGVMQTFCGFDTGHDNSNRISDFGKYVYSVSDQASDRPKDSDVLPVIMPDMNAVCYGNKIALSRMAMRLGLKQESLHYQKEAETLKKHIIQDCYDEQDDFFYDVDKNGNKRKIKTIGLTTLFVSEFLDKEEGKRLFKKYFTSPEYFGTEYPYPSVAVKDKAFCKNAQGNSWNYYSQGLTMLRTLLWMDDYGLSDYLESNMEKWVTALTLNDGMPFCQELDPFTGKPSTASPYYSSAMLFYLLSLKRLGID